MSVLAFVWIMFLFVSLLCSHMVDFLGSAGHACTENLCKCQSQCCKRDHHAGEVERTEREPLLQAQSRQPNPREPMQVEAQKL